MNNKVFIIGVTIVLTVAVVLTAIWGVSKLVDRSNMKKVAVYAIGLASAKDKAAFSEQNKPHLTKFSFGLNLSKANPICDGINGNIQGLYEMRFYLEQALWAGAITSNDFATAWDQIKGELDHQYELSDQNHCFESLD